MKRVTLTLREYTNNQNEKKKQRVNVGRIHTYQDGGESIVLDAALCATIAAMAQKALNNGEDSVWLSMFEDKPQQQTQQYTTNQQPIIQNPVMQQPAPQQNQQYTQNDGVM